jgi:hypothetical protein
LHGLRMTVAQSEKARAGRKGKAWRDYPLAETLARRFCRPPRLLNDAEVQGLGIVHGHGLEVVLVS